MFFGLLLYEFTKNSSLLNVLILEMDLKSVCFLSLLLSLSLLKVLTPKCWYKFDLDANIIHIVTFAKVICDLQNRLLEIAKLNAKYVQKVSRQNM